MCRLFATFLAFSLALLVPLNSVADYISRPPRWNVPVLNALPGWSGKTDENLRLQNLWDGIEIYAAVLTGL